MSSEGNHTASAGPGGSRPPPLLAQSESTREKKDLVGWWKTFKRGDKKAPEQGKLCQHIISFVPPWRSIVPASSIDRLPFRRCAYLAGMTSLTITSSASSTRHIRCPTSGQHSICKCRHQPVQRRGSKLYLRLCAHRSRQVWRVLEREG
jgi:hypothetical protein